MATNYFTGATVDKALSDNSGNAVLIKCTVANLPSAVAGYSVSCLAIATDTGALYVNTGTATSATFSLIGTVSAGSVTATELASNAVTTAKIANNAVDGTKIALTGNAAGSVMYYDGTDWVSLAIGTAGQVLTVNAGGTAPEWA